MTYPGIEEQDQAGVAAAASAGAKAPAATPASPYGLIAWGSKFAREEFDIVCPSGQRCRARSLQIEDAMSLGVLDSLDVFTPAAMAGISEDGSSKSADDAGAALISGLSDPERRANFFGTVNKIVQHCVVIPNVVLFDDGNLPEGTVFANDIPFPDKMHIFRAVFSGRGDALNSFREGQEADVAPLETESGVPMQTE